MRFRLDKAGQPLLGCLRRALRNISVLRFCPAKAVQPLVVRFQIAPSGMSVLRFGLAKDGKALLTCVGRASKDMSFVHFCFAKKGQPLLDRG